MKNKTLQKKKFDFSSYALYFGAVIILIGFTVACNIAGKNFLTLRNIQNIISQSSCVAVVAIGASLVILTGGIDLSAAPSSALWAFSAPCSLKKGMAIPVAFLIGHRGRGHSGADKRRGDQLRQGTGLYRDAGHHEHRPGAGVPNQRRQIHFRLPHGSGGHHGHQGSGHHPISIIYVFILYALMFFVMTCTRYGRRIYALGGNVRAAKLSGVRVRKVEVSVYLLAGIFSAIAGLMLLSRLFYADPNTGTGYEMDAIASCVIGGISLSGGKGKILNTLVGALILGMLTCGLQILNISTHWQTIISGAVIVGAVYLDKAKERKAE